MQYSSCAELKYNITADVHHKDGFPSRFYFIGNGTSNLTAGRVKVKHEQLTCATHQAFMKVRHSVHVTLSLYSKANCCTFYGKKMVYLTSMIHFFELFFFFIKYLYFISLSFQLLFLIFFIKYSFSQQ